MKIITLVENTSCSSGLTAEHGLSIYAETDRHRLLADTGQTDAVISNADKLGIDLSAVDTVVLSHGHYDHSGGIMPFYKINNTAKLYMHRLATEPHFNGERYIGIDPDISKLPDVILTDNELRIDEELFLFSGVMGRRCYPQGNRRLTSIANGQKTEDSFAHEQYLVISSGGRQILISGCAHNGILNILDRYHEIFGSYPDYVISGFHMMKRDGEYTEEEKSVIIQTAKELSRIDTVFYTGHCTGEAAFNIMKNIIGDQITALHTGEKIL